MARKAKTKKNRTGLLGKTRGMLRVSLKQSAKKATKAGYTATKTRTANAGTKSMAAATMAGKAPNKSNLSRFGKLKLAAKQEALNIKGKAKSFGRKGGTMSAKHRKAISDGLKKRFGRG